MRFSVSHIAVAAAGPDGAAAQQVRPDRQRGAHTDQELPLRFAVAACSTLAVAGPNGQPLPSKYDLIANVVHNAYADY
jgi:hypothetical protein